MYVINEKDIKLDKLPGRDLGWIFKDESMKQDNWSMCYIEVMPRENVRPAHAHPDADEIVYIVEGKGQVLIGEQIYDVCKGSVILFPKNVPHMLKNTRDEKLRAICFYAPSTDYSKYKFFEDIDF
ncbi:MAG: cupin domain-containing protein [Clostridiales bacterium]|mgnify:CR=1 FL=1|jgi:mannose-6-phosphate isomerase-like protein (cupin superfamily)|nr:cupin domain-containing protein [Clostridiales bacterium]